MLRQLHHQLPALLDELYAIGEWQRAMQGRVETRSKVLRDAAGAWERNDVFSEVDVGSEERLLRFWRAHFGECQVVSEELHADVSAPDPSLPTLILDPLDGTRPYLAGSDGFGISVGVLHHGRMLFGINHFPAMGVTHWAFADQPELWTPSGPLPPPPPAPRLCYRSSRFPRVLRHPDRFEAETGLEVADDPRCATVAFKHLIEGARAAYLAVDAMLWDLAPSALLLERAGCGLFQLDGSPVDWSALARPPYRHPGVVALPKREAEAFFSRLRPLLSGPHPSDALR